jgi:hypothetical protein
MRIVAVILHRSVIDQILTHLGTRAVQHHCEWFASVMLAHHAVGCQPDAWLGSR